jgi:hypothetical protein
MFNFKIKIRIICAAIIIATVFLLVWLAIIPSGKISYSTDFKGFNDFISQLTPKERVTTEKDGTQDIFSNPAYFSLRTSRPFNQAKMTVRFQPSENIPIAEIGVSKDGRTWQYDLHPLYNAKLENLMKNWTVVRSGDVMLIQRNNSFSSIDAFLKNPPTTDKLALYNYDWKGEFILPGYQARNATTTLCRPLIGAYQFYTYIKNENLSDDFVFEDLNKNTGPSPVDINVYYQGKLIDTEHLDDDGVIDGLGALRSPRELGLNLANLPEGVYKIDIRAGGDIITRTITTKQSKLSFINVLPLADAPEVSCGRDFYTDGRTLSVQTSHPNKLGVIKLNKNNGSSEDLNISEPYKIFTAANLPTSGTRIVLANDGVSLSSDGLFSLDADSMIDPRVNVVDANFDADQEGTDYILARYTPPIRQGDWLVAQTDFDLTNSFRMWNKYYFIISAPGLAVDNELKIKDVKVDLLGTSLWNKIFKK